MLFLLLLLLRRYKHVFRKKILYYKVEEEEVFNDSVVVRLHTIRDVSGTQMPNYIIFILITNKSLNEHNHDMEHFLKEIC